MSLDGPVLAAGAVVWRLDKEQRVRVAVVHRPRYDDWTFPKGKLDPDEPRALAAVREVAEETGLNVALGRHLAVTSYRPGGRPKLVNYWAARVLGGKFAVNDEVDQLRWVSTADAAALLSYPYDVRVLERFAAAPTDTSTLLLVRHARAGSRKRFTGDDRLRPLEAAGCEQAAALVPLLRAFGASSVYAADRTRCVQTVQPLADALGVPVHCEPALSDEAEAADPVAARRRIAQIARKGGTPVVCSQGDAIPNLINDWAARDQLRLPPSRNRKASTWVVSAQGGHTVALDHLDSPFR